MDVFDQNAVFNAIPGQIDPREFRKGYQKKLLDSLKLHLSGVSKAAGLDLSSQMTKLEGVDPRRRFSPILYTLYAQLKEAYERKKLDEILDCVQLLSNESCESFYGDLVKYGTILSEAWERPFLKEIRERVPLDESVHPVAGGLKVFPLVHWEQADFPPTAFRQSLDLLQKLDPLLFAEVDAYVSRVKFYSSQNLHSVTSPRYFGAIYMRLPFPEENPELFFLETLIHETSHLHLFVIMDRNILVLNNEHDLFASPLRADRRPMMGVFHAVFVLSRMIRILRKVCDANPNNEEAKKLLEKRKTVFQDGMATVSKEAELSEEGRILFNTLHAAAYE